MWLQLLDPTFTDAVAQAGHGALYGRLTACAGGQTTPATVCATVCFVLGANDCNMKGALGQAGALRDSADCQRRSVHGCKGDQTALALHPERTCVCLTVLLGGQRFGVHGGGRTRGHAGVTRRHCGAIHVCALMACLVVDVRGARGWR